MRALIVFAVTAVVALAGICARGATPGASKPKEKPPATVFSVVIQGKYARRWITIHREGEEWICATESNPDYPADGDPLDDVDFKAFPKNGSGSGCRDAVAVEDRRTSRVRRAAGCLADPVFHELVAKLDQRCRGE